MIYESINVKKIRIAGPTFSTGIKNIPKMFPKFQTVALPRRGRHTSGGRRVLENRGGWWASRRKERSLKCSALPHIKNP